MKLAILFISLSIAAYAYTIKTVIEIESCAESGRCRVKFDDNSTDLLWNPYIGQKVVK